jgi:phosphoglycolate phosphatase
VTIKPLAAVAFDLDGTLIDSAPDIAVALNAALDGAGLPAVAIAGVRVWIGDGPDMLIRHALDHLQVQATALLRAELRHGFEQATLAAPMALGRVFDGVEALLGRWHGRWPMAVVTNKPTLLSRSVLGAAGLLRYFASVHGADTPAQRKPAPMLLLEAAAALGVAPQQLLMVGDSGNDLRCAHAAGCPAAWVAWGYGAFAPPPGAAVRRIDQPAQLDDAIADVIGTA